MSSAFNRCHLPSIDVILPSIDVILPSIDVILPSIDIILPSMCINREALAATPYIANSLVQSAAITS